MSLFLFYFLLNPHVTNVSLSIKKALDNVDPPNQRPKIKSCFTANSIYSGGNSCGMPPREKPIKGVRDTAITILGSRPDIDVASIITPREFMEYPYLTVFQDDKKAKQGNFPTDNAQPLLRSEPSLASRAVLDTGSMAGECF